MPDLYAELRLNMAASAAIKAAITKIANALDECAHELHALEMQASSEPVIESIQAAARAIEDDYRSECLEAIERVITDELFSDSYIETQLEDIERDEEEGRKEMAAEFQRECRRDDEMFRRMGLMS